MLLTKHMYLCGARIPFVLFGENFIQWPWFQLRYVSQLSCANSLICWTVIKSFQVLYSSYPSFYHHYLASIKHKASSSIHMISKSDSSFSSFCSDSACWRLLREQCSAMATCQARVMVLPRPMLPTDAVLQKTKTITTKQQVVLPRSLLRADIEKMDIKN